MSTILRSNRQHLVSGPSVDSWTESEDVSKAMAGEKEYLDHIHWYWFCSVHMRLIFCTCVSLLAKSR